MAHSQFACGLRPVATRRSVSGAGGPGDLVAPSAPTLLAPTAPSASSRSSSAAGRLACSWAPRPPPRSPRSSRTPGRRTRTADGRRDRVPTAGEYGHHDVARGQPAVCGPRRFHDPPAEPGGRLPRGPRTPEAARPTRSYSPRNGAAQRRGRAKRLLVHTPSARVRRYFSPRGGVTTATSARCPPASLV